MVLEYIIIYVPLGIHGTQLSSKLHSEYLGNSFFNS